MASAKSQFRMAVEGVFVGHPIHVMVVHLPIGLWGISLVFDLAWLADLDGDWLLTASRWSMAIGTAFAVIAGFTGVVDWLGVRRDHPAQRIILYHMVMNVIASGLYLFNTILRFNAADLTAISWVPIGMSIIGYALVMVSGYLGGVLIYDDGIGVGRHRKETTSPEVTITSDHIADMDMPQEMPAGYAAVAESAALPEDGTLRIKLNEHTICLVRSAGRVYALQEFCTHRYGPLSEGAIHNGCLECPWHNSCFNLTTGEPVEGPAKVPLKIYNVMESSGMICVQVPSDTHETATPTQPTPARAPTSSPQRGSTRGSERDWERPQAADEAARRTPADKKDQ